MPAIIIPKRFGPHRVACIALYRALIRKCALIELPPDVLRGPINPIHHLVRKAFKRNRHVVSLRLVAAALKVGYEAEDLLHSASNGDTVAHSKVITLLREVQEKGNIERAKQQENPTIFLSLFAGGPVIKRPKPPKPAPYPGAPKVLDVRPRPKEELTGTRKVPKLLAMNGYPVLRFNKPQSAYLTRILSQKMDKKVKRMANTVKLDELGPIAHGEDVWDAVLSKTAGIQYNRKEPRWAESIVTISEEIKDDIWKDYTKVKETARRMLKIVDAEAELAEKEKMEWRREKRKVKLDRRAEKREASDGGRSPPPTNDS